LTVIKFKPNSVAAADAKKVLPQPGGPYNKSPIYVYYYKRIYIYGYIDMFIIIREYYIYIFIIMREHYIYIYYYERIYIYMDR